MSVGWSFPEKSDGSFDGFNHPGIETFQGARYASLAREVLQNSLDSQVGDGCVQVFFELKRIKRADLPGCDEMKAVIERCRVEAKDEKQKSFFDSAHKILSDSTVPCLQIEDYGTTGLTGGNDAPDQSPWYALTKMSSDSVGKRDDAGGSYGIGKYAPFTVSDLRTVFYYTRYDSSDGGVVEKMQGKSILMSHRGHTGVVNAQGTGYYGLKDGCRPIESEIWPELRRKDGAGAGTTLLIPGFQHNDGYAKEIEAIVLSNFFYAVHSGKLEVLVASEGGGGDNYTIEKDNLSERFEDLLRKSDDENRKELENAKWYYDAIVGGGAKCHKTDTQDRYLEHCRLHVTEGEGAPSRVAVIRNTGMLITDQMVRLKRFSGVPDFAGVLVCESTEGNKLLRNMENPQHNQFEPDRLPAPERKRGDMAIRSITNWVRGELRKLIGQQATDEPTDLEELSSVIPNEDDETLGGESGHGEGLSGRLIIVPRVGKKQGAAPGGDEGKDGPGLDKERPGRNKGSGKSGVAGSGGGSAKRLPLGNFRFIPGGNSGSVKVFFVPKFSGDGVLNMHIAGDSDTERLNIDRIEMLSDGIEVRKKKSQYTLVSCKAGERVVMHVFFQGGAFADGGAGYSLVLDLTAPSNGDQ